MLRSRWTCVALALVAVAVAPASAPAQRLARLPWWQRAEERPIGHYRIRTDVEPALANGLARHLNLMHEEYARRLASLPPRAPAPLNVLIFDRRQDYLSVLRQRFGVDATGTSGMFFVMPAGSGLAFWTEGLSRSRINHVLQHEGFHQFAYSRFGGDLPRWVNEGLAEFFGHSVLVDETLILGQSTPGMIGAVKQAIEQRTYIPFRTMLNLDAGQWSESLRNGQAALQYRQAWSMVHFLVYGDGGKYVGAFEGYLRLVNNGVLSEDAFVRAFGPDIEAFERQWKRYAEAAVPGAFVTAMERLEFLARGALALRERDLQPTSLDQMREQLVAIGFSERLSLHGLDVVQDADDASLYTIPKDDLAQEQPVLLVERFDPNRLPMRMRRLEQDHPSPVVLRTGNLRPGDLHVRWIRDEEHPDRFTYEIEVRR